MQTGKQKVSGFEAEILALLHTSSLRPRARIEHVHTLVWNVIEKAKIEKDGLSQLYGCMVEATMQGYGAGNEDVSALAEHIQALTKTDHAFRLADELKVKPPANSLLVDADMYGFYYALNDHYSQRWDPRNYALAKNASVGNPLITNLFRMMCENEKGEPLYHIPKDGYVEHARNRSLDHPLRDGLLASFSLHDTHVFSDMRLAFVGGGSLTYEEVVTPLLAQFPRGHFLDFSPSSGGKLLSMKRTDDVLANGQSVDYVVSSNVLNALKHHIDPEKRDLVFACAAKILKKGGKAVHLMEKVTRQETFDVCLTRSLHRSVGQDLIYSFFRDKGPMDTAFDQSLATVEEGLRRDFGTSDIHYRGKLLTLDEYVSHHLKNDSAIEERQAAHPKNFVLDGKPNDFRTSMLVLYQSDKKYITNETVAATKERLNRFEHRFGYYDKPVYVERPGMQRN